MSRTLDRRRSALVRAWRAAAMAALAAPLALSAMAGPAAAQGVPVIDAAAVAEATQNVKAAAQQIEQLDALLGQVQGIVQTVGKEGLPTLAFQTALSESGLSRFGPPIKDLLGSVQGTVQQVQSTVAAARTVQGQLASLGQTPDFSSFTAAQGWVRQTLTTTRDADLNAISTARKARNLLAGEAVADAYAMALNARQQVAGTATRAQQLAQQAGQATDLRGGMAANTAVMLAMHDEMAQIQALMAALLEMQSAGRLAELHPSAGATAAAAATPSGASTP